MEFLIKMGITLICGIMIGRSMVFASYLNGTFEVEPTDDERGVYRLNICSSKKLMDKKYIILSVRVNNKSYYENK